MNGVALVIAEEALKLLFKTIESLIEKSSCDKTSQEARDVVNNVKEGVNDISSWTGDNKEELH